MYVYLVNVSISQMSLFQLLLLEFVTELKSIAPAAEKSKCLNVKKQFRTAVDPLSC